MVVQLTVVRLVIRDTIEQELYERNNDIGDNSTAVTSTISQLGVEVSLTHCSSRDRRV